LKERRDLLGTAESAERRAAEHKAGIEVMAPLVAELFGDMRKVRVSLAEVYGHGKKANLTFSILTALKSAINALDVVSGFEQLRTGSAGSGSLACARGDTPEPVVAGLLIAPQAGRVRCFKEFAV
jgi:hypothetical protein